MNHKSGAATSIHGHYYRKQIECKDRFIAWSHASRFVKAVQLIGNNRVSKLMDYGCGDGTMLTMISERADECWGADIAEDQLQDCRLRLGNLANTHFCSVLGIQKPKFEGAFDVVLCMETLEHCVEESASQVIDDLAFLCSPNGRVIISVPIEIGPSFLLKQSIRKVAAWRGLSDYKYYEKYSIRNGLRMIFATSNTVFERPAYGPEGSKSLSHYGFNWKVMRQKVANVMDIERVTFSPLASLAGLVSSQAWFICRPKRRK